MPLRAVRRIALATALACAASAAAELPFYPSAINTVTGLPVSPSQFTPAAQCAYCHPLQHEEWRGSMHANAFADPLYQAAWREASRELGGAMDRLCAGCHTPVGTATEQVWIRESGEIVIHPIAQEGVTCDFCHTVAGAELLERGGVPGNSGLILDPGGPKRGPYPDAFSTFHETAYSDLHTRSEFCGACHNVFHPVSGTAIARTYEEWKGSVYAAEEIHCQDCHMVPPEVAAGVAATLEKPVLSGLSSNFDTVRSPFYHHTFTGANAAIPALLGFSRHAGDAVSRLRTAARVGVEVTPAPQPGGEGELMVRVRNTGAGHNLPTSMTELRQMWLHVIVVDEGRGGRVVWESGALDSSGALDPSARTFGAEAVDEAGVPTWKPWKVARIARDNTIPPRAQALETYRFPVPADARGPLRVRATLRYRSFPQGVADRYLDRPGYVVPVVDMAEGETAVHLTRR
jgi:hypothetical protein